MNEQNKVYLAIYAWAVVALAFTAVGAATLYRFVVTDAVGLLASGTALFILTSAYVLHRMIDALLTRLEEGELRLETIVNGASDGILAIDSAGRIQTVNPSAQRLFGYRESELNDAPFTSLIAYDSAPTESGNFMAVVAGAADVREVGVFTLDGIRKDGTTFPVEASISESYYEEAPLYTLVVRDATARRETERAQERRRHELELHVRERTKALEDANASLEAEIERRNEVEGERQKLLTRLQDALARIKTLNGLIPICASCKKVRDDSGYWNQIEEYVARHSHAEFSHGVCPDCVTKLYPEFSARSTGQTMPMD